MRPETRENLSTLFTVLRIFGGMAFVLSFGLDGVTTLSGHGAGPTGPIPGFRCAIFSLMFLPTSILYLIGFLLHDPMAHGDFLQLLGLQCISFSGLVNPLLLCCLLSWGKWHRRYLIAIGICLVITIPGILLCDMAPLSGCYIWMAATLLILSPELVAPTVPTEEPYEDLPMGTNRFLVPNDVRDLHSAD